MLFLLCSLYRLSSVSVVFDFNASLNDDAPATPISLSVVFMRVEKGDLLMSTIYVVSFVFTTQLDLSECCV